MTREPLVSRESGAGFAGHWSAHPALKPQGGNWLNAATNRVYRLP